jgi:DNA-binding transcriptional LysR family regulator
VIADLEHALAVRLLDRTAQSIEPTIYGDALLKRSLAVFDELKQSIKDIEYLSDATTGEVRIGSMEAPWSRSCLLLTAHRQPTFSGNIELIQRKRVLVDGIDVLVVFSKLLTTYHPLGSEGINASCCIRGCPSDTRRAAF